ncbi:MAG TPA: DUF3015 family protein [Nitrospira sp.]
MRRKLIAMSMWLLILCSQPMLALGIPNPDTGPGCGLGKKLWSGSKNQKNIMPQVFMATTNVTGFQTFAISSGTSGCSNDGVVWADHKVRTFVAASYDDLIQDMAQGRGEHLASLAALMEVEPEHEAEFFVKVQAEHRPFAEAGSEFLFEWLRVLHEDMARQKVLAAFSRER